MSKLHKDCVVSAAPKWFVCPYCERRYQYCNWMSRREKYGWNREARRVEDVHLVACKSRERKATTGGPLTGPVVRLA